MCRQAAQPGQFIGIKPGAALGVRKGLGQRSSVNDGIALLEQGAVGSRCEAAPGMDVQHPTFGYGRTQLTHIRCCLLGGQGTQGSQVDARALHRLGPAACHLRVIARLQLRQIFRSELLMRSRCQPLLPFTARNRALRQGHAHIGMALYQALLHSLKACLLACQLGVQAERGIGSATCTGPQPHHGGQRSCCAPQAPPLGWLNVGHHPLSFFR